MVEQEALIRLSAFVLVLGTLVVFERLWPWRASHLGWRRWGANLGLAAVATALLRLLAPAGVVGVALWAETRGFGLLPLLGLPFVAAAVLSIVLLDLVVYLQHRLFHAVPVLWRVHRVHHADPELDATSGVRFHPLEILLSLVFKAGVVIVLGAPAEAVLAFEVLLNAFALFTHANIGLSPQLERILRLVIVTPTMHRIHHSERREETDSDFGFCLSVWDRLFGTYRAAPAGGEAALVLGVGWRAAAEQRLLRLLVQPFRRNCG